MPVWLSLILRVTLFGLGLGVSFLPRKAELWLGPRLGRLVLRLGGFKWRTALDNIRHCLPDMESSRQELLLRKNFEHYGTLFFEFLHLFSPLKGHYRSYAQSLCALEGYENWKRASDKGKGVLFVSCHLGFWEMLAAAGGLAGMPLTVMTTVLKPPWLDALITAARLDTGVRAIYPGGVASVLRALRKGESVAFMNDQYAYPPIGLPVRFFGVQVDTLAAVGPLAKRTGAAVVPVSAYRDREGRMRVVIEPELNLGQALENPREATQVLAEKVEEWVRRRPEQWLWIHRRFKNVNWAVA